MGCVVNEPLGIALELMQRRKALAARLSPQARKLAFPDIARREQERRLEIKYRIKRIESDWAGGKRVPAREKALAMESKTRVVVQTCARLWGVPASMIYSEGKLRMYVLPRRAAMSLMRELFSMTLPSIGITLNRDHTTCVHALQKHEETYDCYADYARKYDMAEAELRAAFRETPDAGRAAGDEVDGRTERPSCPSSATIREAA